jgi:hypothetical protein
MGFNSAFKGLKGLVAIQPKWPIYAFLGRDPWVENLLYSDYVQTTVSLHVHEIQIANVGHLGGREGLCFDVYEQNETLGERCGNETVSCLRYREDNCLYLAGTLNRAKLASTFYNKTRTVLNKS